MTRWSRRRFLAATAATVCAGCADTGAGQGVTVGTARSDPQSGPDLPGGPDSLPDDLPGLGAAIAAGTFEQLSERVDAEGAVYVAAARAWLVRFPADAVEDAIDSYDPALEDGLRLGLLALHQRCPHLGCRVPFCSSSGWFECPCHGSRFNAVGEHRAGPGPRGLDAFVLRVEDDEVLIDTGRIVTGRPLTTRIDDRVPAGPHCTVLEES